MLRPRFLLLALALSLFPLACGGSKPPPQDASAAAREAANRRLVGTWVLTAFMSEQSLEPMLQALLGAQIGRMTIRFDGSNMVVSGTGVTTTRRYVVTQAYGDDIAIRSFDAEGVAYDVRGSFRGDGELEFESLTSPWRGHGALRRVQ